MEPMLCTPCTGQQTCRERPMQHPSHSEPCRGALLLHHGASHLRTLTLVRRDDADLLRLHVVRQEH